MPSEPLHRRAGQSISLLGLALPPGLGRMRRLYRALRSNNSLCEARSHLYPGYRDENTHTLEEAMDYVLVGAHKPAAVGGCRHVA